MGTPMGLKLTASGGACFPNTSIASESLPLAKKSTVSSSDVRMVKHTCSGELPPCAVYSYGAWHGGEKIELNHKYAIAVLIDRDTRTEQAIIFKTPSSNSER